MENKDNKEPLINNVEENNQSALNWQMHFFFPECNPYTGIVYILPYNFWTSMSLSINKIR